MRLKRLILLPLLSLGMIGASVAVIGLNQNNEDKVDAYTISTLPTTIYLRDNTPSEIRSYYSDLVGKTDSELSGTNLLKNLKPILKNNQKYLAYDGSNDDRIWDAYCIVDRDWTKSPASELPSSAGTFNSSENRIENYNWSRNNNSNPNENPYLHALYYNRKYEPIARAYGDHNNNTDTGINREHIWPKGAGFNTSGSGGARGDLMHLWAANGATNNDHSNHYYGYVDTTRSYSDEKTKHSMCEGNLKGYSKSMGGNTKVFEPQDDDKGDIARACFYMVARYNYYGNVYDSDGFDVNNPNLELVNNLTSWSSSGYNSDEDTKGQLGILQDLLEWNRIDPPDAFEIHRNNLCYNNFTGNRNPFIDFPEWAEYIWGKSTSGSYNPSSTGHASPSSDTINAFSGDTPTPSPTLSSISVSGQKTAFTVGDTFSFGGTVTATYSDASTDNVTASATFNGYDMSTAGNQTVTVSYTESGTTKTTTYQITVSDSPSPTPTPTPTQNSYAITFNKNGSDSSSALTTETIGQAIVSNELVDTFTSVSRVYKGINGIKYGTSSYQGIIGGTLVEGAQSKIESIVISSSSYGSDTGKLELYLDGTKLTEFNPADGLTYNFLTETEALGSASNFTLQTSEKRAYVESIKFNINNDSVSLNKNSTSIEAGESETLTATASGAVTWTSSDPTVATVTNGVVNALKEGSTTITATCGLASATCEVTVTETPTPTPSVDGLYFRRITSLSEVTTGKYVIATNVSGTYKALPNAFGSQPGGQTVTVTDGKIDADDATSFVVTIAKNNSGNVSIYNESKYLTFPNSGTNFGSSNDETFYSIETIQTGGTFLIKNSQASPRGLVYRASSYNKFGNYATSNINGTEYFGIELFKEEQASAYAYNFLDAFTCDSSGVNAPTFKTGKSWSGLETAYNALDLADRTALANATANEKGNTIEQAVARYDYVAHKYQYENFMSRSTANTLQSYASIFNESTAAIVVCILLVVSITTVGAIIVLKKKQQ